VRIAWSVAGGLTVAMFLSVVWATHTVTKARGEVGHLNMVVRQLSDTVETRSRDAEKFRAEAETAGLTAAKIEGQLDIVRQRVDELNREKLAIEAKLTVTTQPASTQPVH
jgi:chromosome segregation ATPase